MTKTASRLESKPDWCPEGSTCGRPASRGTSQANSTLHAFCPPPARKGAQDGADPRRGAGEKGAGPGGPSGGGSPTTRSAPRRAAAFRGRHPSPASGRAPGLARGRDPTHATTCAPPQPRDPRCEHARGSDPQVTPHRREYVKHQVKLTETSRSPRHARLPRVPLYSARRSQGPPPASPGSSPRHLAHAPVPETPALVLRGENDTCSR